MPSSGDIKWMSNEKLSSKKAISDALNIATTKQNWAEYVLQMAAENATLCSLLSALAILVALPIGTFYSQYKTGLLVVFKQIENLPSTQKFTIEQKYKWHAGQRSWQPLNTFRVVFFV